MVFLVAGGPVMVYRGDPIWRETKDVDVMYICDPNLTGHTVNEVIFELPFWFPFEVRK